MKRFLPRILIPLILVLLIWGGFVKFEGEKPQIDVDLPSSYLKKDFKFRLDVTDRKSGLDRVVVSIMQQGKEQVLIEQKYTPDSAIHFMSGSKKLSDTFLIPVPMGQLPMTDGAAVIRIMVADASLRNWGKGNIAYIEKQVLIDTTAPRLRVLSRQHNIEQGGERACHL